MKKPTKIDLLFTAAEARDQRRYSDARKMYEEVLRIGGPDPEVMRAVAECEFALYVIHHEDTEPSHGRAALDWITRAIELDPNVPMYHYALGSMREHVVTPDYQGAAAAYRRAIEIEPFFHSALHALASLRGVPEQVVTLEEGIRSCETALRVRPTRSLWLRLSRLYSEAGQPQQSERALAKSFTESFEEEAWRY